MSTWSTTSTASSDITRPQHLHCPESRYEFLMEASWRSWGRSLCAGKVKIKDAATRPFSCTRNISPPNSSSSRPVNPRMLSLDSKHSRMNVSMKNILHAGTMRIWVGTDQTVHRCPQVCMPIREQEFYADAYFDIRACDRW